MVNSTHKVEVFRVTHMEKHPNADTLSIMTVFNYQAVVRTSDFHVGDLACYIPPDNVLPDEPQYEFLKGHRHIKASKLRGIMSQGLVLQAPAGAQEGDDVAEQLKIVHYVPDIKNSGDGEMIADPPFGGEKYDIDSWYRYDLIPEGTPVEITEKLDGANTRASFQDGQLWIGSRENYRKEVTGGFFWRAMQQNPWLERLCRQNPDAVVYGELFGKVQALRYGAQGNQVFFRMFDIMTLKGYMNHATKMAALATAVGSELWEPCYAPVLYVGPFSKDLIAQYVNGPSTVPGATNEREGIVVKPLEEMWSPEIGRLILKAVSPIHMANAKG